MPPVAKFPYKADDGPRMHIDRAIGMRIGQIGPRKAIRLGYGKTILENLNIADSEAVLRVRTTDRNADIARAIALFHVDARTFPQHVEDREGLGVDHPVFRDGGFNLAKRCLVKGPWRRVELRLGGGAIGRHWTGGRRVFGRCGDFDGWKFHRRAGLLGVGRERPKGCGSHKTCKRMRALARAEITGHGSVLICARANSGNRRRRPRWIGECSSDESRRSARRPVPIDAEEQCSACRDRPGDGTQIGIRLRDANGSCVEQQRTGEGGLTKRTMVVVRWTAVA